MSSPVPPTPLPRAIRKEVKMAVCLKALSQMKEGGSKNLTAQYEEMHKFFHGKEPTFPSQLKLFCEASLAYRDFYESKFAVLTSKESSNDDAETLILKPSLTLNNYVYYRAKIDIKHNSLEKKSLSGKQLIAGRALLALAKEGEKNFRKANAFAEEKWDVKKREPKESGNTIDDVVKHVRHQMYKFLNSGKPSIDEAEMEQEEEFCLKNAATDDTDNLEMNDNETGGIAGGGNEIDGIQAGNNDAENVVPETYIFPGFMAFMVWGPFAEPNDQLSLFMTSDRNYGGGKGRAEKRKARKIEKDIIRKDDNANERGMTIDQKISYESLLMQKENQIHLKNESNLTAIGMTVAASKERLESAVRMAALRCPDYDEDNKHWKRVEALEKDHDELVDDLNTHTQMMLKDKTVSGGLDDIVNPKQTAIEKEQSNKNGKKKSDEYVNVLYGTQIDDNHPRSNCRGKKCGDNGSMYGLGEKGDDEFSLSKNNEDIQQMMATIGEKCSTWYRKEFHDEFLEMEQLKKDYDSLDYMTDSPSPFVIVSQNLSNSSHYDIGDEVNSITTWTEETLGNTLNWKFVFPNVSINNNPGKALVIILSDGLTISWNGALLRHGSSRTNERVKDGGSSFGFLMSRKKRKGIKL